MLKNRRWIIVASALVATAATLIPGTAPVRAGPLPSVEWDGSALRDPAGRQVTMRGLTIAAGPDDSLDETGADLIASWGFNFVRLGMTWKGIEPVRGDDDESYLARMKTIVRVLASRGIATLLSLNQDVYHERYGGSGGAPDWAVNSPVPPTNTGAAGTTYVTPAVMNEYDLFWANVNGVRDAYADAWMRVAAVFAGEPGILGYDLFDAPWPGTQWASCAHPAGCPAFDDLTLDRFYRHVAAGIRTIDPDRMIYVSPAIPARFGGGTAVGPVTDRAQQTGLSFRVDCAPVCASQAMGTQTRRASAIAAHPLLVGSGASDEPTHVERLIELAEAAGTGSYAFGPFDDSASRLALEMLKVIARPYAQAVAGTNVEQDWIPNEMLRTLRLVYDATGGETIIVWPREIQGAYGAGVVCDPPGQCSLRTDGDRIVVRATAGAHVIVSASRLD